MSMTGRRPAICFRMDLSKYSPKYRPIRRLAPLAPGPFGAWLRRVFVTTALEYLRKYDALRSSAPIDEYGEQVEDVDASVLDRLSADDLLECISRLPTGYRTVFNLYAIEGYTHKEIAAMLHIQEITSRSQFARARKALQEMVQSLIA